MNTKNIIHGRFSLVSSTWLLAFALACAGTSGTATVKLHANRVACPALLTTAWTVTSSPGENGCEGRKLAPSPCE